MVRLAEIAAPVVRAVPVEPGTSYRTLGVRWWGEGAYERETIDGARTAAKKLSVVRTDDLIINKIWVRHGSAAIVPPLIDGCVASSEFPTFKLNRARVVPRWLHWYAKTRAFWNQCDSLSRGTSGKNRIRPDLFLGIEIPLPPIAEQCRIVARIEELAAKVEEAQVLREGVRKELGALSRSLFRKTAWPTIKVREAVRLREPDVTVRPDEVYQFAGVYSFGRGVFQGPTRVGSSFSYPKLSRLRQGDLVYPKLMAWEGAIGIVPEDCCGRVVSTEFPVFEVDQMVVYPEVLDAYFRSPSTWPLLAEASAGTNVRRRRLHPERFLALEIPLPSSGVQRLIRVLSRRTQEIWQEQEGSSPKLDALLPSILDKAFRGEL